jgi:DNA polymerase III delta prime subunit
MHLPKSDDMRASPSRVEAANILQKEVLVQKYLQGEDIILWQTEELIIHGIFFLAG